MQEEFGKAPNTKGAYKGYPARGRAILADVVAEGDASRRRILAPWWIETVWTSSSWPLLSKGHQTSTPRGSGKEYGRWESMVHSRNYWDHLPDSGRKYAGDYLFNAETGKVSGNPARALEIPSFLKCIKNIAWVKGAAANRHHAEATTIEDMRMSHKKLEDVPKN
ncbi:hypothetical protein B0H14DRAFT_2632859 [Mycena olivaceomarginata]|nr:hypothetical protein B0H14DRAFT_2632859 [Mycena olivaceomarginata]